MTVICEIEFDNNPHGTYFAGQVMTGKVTLKLDKVKVLKAITLNINGYAATQWSNRVNEQQQPGVRKDHLYFGREDYIASQTFLAGSSLSNQVSIEPGIHIYNFVCPIPVECPSSFEGTIGHVRYTTNVTLVRPWKFDQNYTRCFTVLKLMDLNYNSPLLRVPAHSETQKTFCCWPCSSDPLALQLTLPQTGFVPGQSCPLSVVVINDSHIPVKELIITLVMLVTYHSKPPSRPSSTSEKFVVNTLKGDAVLRNCKKQFNYDLRVPATPPTCFNLCGIIQIAYQLEVEAKMKGCHTSEIVSVPVTIGSVPLSENVFMQPRGLENPPPTVNGGAPIAALPAPVDVTQPWAVDQSISPPNYQEALHMRANVTHQPADPGHSPSAPPNTLSLDGSAYKPLYPVFDIPSPTMQNNMIERGFANPGADLDKEKGTWL